MKVGDIKEFFSASGVSTRACSSHRKRKTEHCPHQHRTRRGAEACCVKMLARDKAATPRRHRFWHVDTVMLVAYPKRAR